MAKCNENGEIIVPMREALIKHFDRFLENPNLTYLNLPVMFRTKHLDISKLEQSIRKILERHPLLRSTYKKVDGKYYQVIHDHIDFSVEECDIKNIEELIKPFDMVNGPLLRVCISNGLLFMDFHHTIIDGISIGLFFQELNTFYSGGTIKTPSIDSTENIFLSDEGFNENRKYWKPFFDSKFTQTVLKTEKPDTKDIGPNTTLYYPVSVELMKNIKDFAIKKKVTPNIITTAAYVLLLAHRNQTSSVNIYTNMSNRTLKNIRTIGLFTMPVIMPFDLKELISVHDLISYVDEHNQEYVKHQQVDIHALLKEKGMVASDVTKTMFVYQREMIAEIMFDGEICEPIPIPEKEVFAQIVMSFFSSRKFPTIQLEYRNDLYEQDFIHKFLDDYIFILNILLSGEELTVREIIGAINNKTKILYGKNARSQTGLCTLTELWNNRTLGVAAS